MVYGLCLELVLVCLAQHLLLKHLTHNGKAQLQRTESNSGSGQKRSQ